jgi:hypothetical protein
MAKKTTKKKDDMKTKKVRRERVKLDQGERCQGLEEEEDEEEDEEGDDSVQWDAL